MAFEELASQETIMIFAAFIIIILVLYKTMKLVTRAAMIGAISFSFPWIIQLLELPLPVMPDIDTGIKFAIIGTGLFLLYEISHFLIYGLNLITWPFKQLLKPKPNYGKLDEEIKRLKTK